MLNPRWNPEHALTELSRHGAEHATLVVRGSPKDNLGMYQVLLRNIFGTSNMSFSTQPVYIGHDRIADEQKGKPRILLVEATRIQRKIGAAKVLDDHHEACVKAGYSAEDWLKVLPLLVIHPDWVYEYTELAGHGIPVLGPDLARKEADSTRSIAIEVQSRRRRIQIREALEGLRRGELVHSRLPAHPLLNPGPVSP